MVVVVVKHLVVVTLFGYVAGSDSVIGSVSWCLVL